MAWFVTTNLRTRHRPINMMPCPKEVLLFLIWHVLYQFWSVVLTNWLGKHMVRHGRVQLDGRKVINLTIWMLNIFRDTNIFSEICSKSPIDDKLSLPLIRVRSWNNGMRCMFLINEVLAWLGVKSFPRPMMTHYIGAYMLWGLSELTELAL